jgi:spermidine synthase
VAAAINFAIAAASYLLASRTPARSDTGDPEIDAPSIEAPLQEAANWPVYLTIAISGATAMGAEVVWTRLMAMILGSTVYVFSIILAVFLIGLALGSGLGSMALRSLRTASGPRLALGWSQVLLTLGIAWTAYMIADSIPFWPVNPMLGSSPWFSFQLDMARCLWAILPPTILWGASFPLACAAVSSSSRDSSHVVGAVYAANTLGAIVGALLVSITLVPAIGTQNSQRAMLLLSAAGALVMLLPQLARSRSVPLTAAVTAAMLLAIQLARGVDAIPGKVIAYGRRIAISSPNSELLYTIEGRNSSVAITRWNDGAIEVDVNGHVEATTEPYDMKLQRMVGHLPGLIHPNPKSVLGIGFGAGVSAGTFTRYPGVEKITVCEIEPVIPPTSTRFFARQDYDVYHNPRTHIVFDDARHYLMTTTEHFDIIASDPLDVFVKGTAALYTKEYFEAVKRHLKPGGMFTLYVPLYESDMRTVKSELATFFEAFPHATVWANTIQGRGYDMVFMGQEGPLSVNIDEMQERLARPDYALVAQSLREIGVPSSIELLGTYAGQKSDLAAWLRDAELNRDGDLRLQYIGGWGINSSMEDLIYRQLMSYRRPPGAIFTGSPQNLQALGAALNTP